MKNEKNRTETQSKSCEMYHYSQVYSIL